MGKIRSGNHSNTNQLVEVKMDRLHLEETSLQCYQATLEIESPVKTETKTRKNT